jgi:hypothetical protein
VCAPVTHAEYENQGEPIDRLPRRILDEFVEPARLPLSRLGSARTILLHERSMAPLEINALSGESNTVSAETDLKQKAVGAFKGFILNYRLDPTRQKTRLSDQDYDQWYGFVQIGEELFDLFPRKRDLNILLSLVDRLYPDQTHRGMVSIFLQEATLEWIKQGHSKDDQNSLEQSAEAFLREVEREIKDLVVYVPVEGIEMATNEPVQLARCQLCPNNPDSELQQVARRDSQRASRESSDFLSAVEQVPAYFRVTVQCHYRKAFERAGEEAELALNVLRFFLSQFDTHLSTVPTEMGILGTLHVGTYNHMYITRDGVALDEQFPGSSTSFRHTEPFKIDKGTVTYIQNRGLTSINLHLQSLKEGDGNEVARSLLRAISWFGKATNARSAGESFLLYAVAVEGLLLGGERPRKETYALRIAALITRQGDEGIFPFGGLISTAFDDNLEAASDRSARFRVVYERAVELFRIRNQIAHGEKLDSEIAHTDLHDFKTLVRNAILSFVIGGWDGLAEFKQWMSRSLDTVYQFHPPPV